MKHPFLVGPRIYLRALTKRDVATQYFQWFNDQESDTFTDHALWPNTKGRMEAFLERVTRGERDLALAIIVRATEQHVGNIGLHRINWVHRRAEMAILIGEPQSRNQGYGTEAIKLLAAYAFNKLNLNRIGLGVVAGNTAAIRAYGKVGFLEEGRFEEHFFRGGRLFDTIRMRLLRKEFLHRFPSEGTWFSLGKAALPLAMRSGKKSKR